MFSKPIQTILISAITVVLLGLSFAASASESTESQAIQKQKCFTKCNRYDCVNSEVMSFCLQNCQISMITNCVKSAPNTVKQVCCHIPAPDKSLQKQNCANLGIHCKKTLDADIVDDLSPDK